MRVPSSGIVCPAESKINLYPLFFLLYLVIVTKVYLCYWYEGTDVEII